MPNKANARKELRKTEKRTVLNNKIKRAYKDAVKEVKKAVDTGQKDAVSLTQIAQKKIDKAAKKGIIKKILQLANYLA